jgi:hypothetical protein
MAKVHVLEADGSGNCHVLIHIPVPDERDKSLVACRLGIVMTQTRATVLVEDCITAPEKASIEAGEVLEIPGLIPLDVLGQGLKAVDQFADALIASYLATTANKFGCYGQTFDKEE